MILIVRNKIIIKGAKEHNLKNIDLEIPHDKLIIITGLSGSGKSSLAFDTIYAEGQRRYVESLSSYARQFLGTLEKPRVDHIEGLSPAISIDQKSTSKNPRSTVGTVTEIYDYLRLLYARVGIPHCPKCNKKIASQSVDEITDQVMKLPENTKIQVLAPIIRSKKGEHNLIFAKLKAQGFVRVRVDGNTTLLDEKIELDKKFKHTIEVVIDRIVMKKGIRERISDSIENALKLSDGLLTISVIDEKTSLEHTDENQRFSKKHIPTEYTFSEKYACPDCNISLEELSPRAFSFNSPYGACSECHGLGKEKKFDVELILDETKSINQGAILPWKGSAGKYYPQLLKSLAIEYNFSLNTPLQQLDKEIVEVILSGSDVVLTHTYTNRFGKVRNYDTRFFGVIEYLKRRLDESSSSNTKEKIDAFMRVNPCKKCNGDRLKPEILSVKVGGISINKFTNFSIKKALEFINYIKFNKKQKLISHEIIKEIKNRLDFLMNVGLDYLTLDREAGTLSGGESQRIRLATQIGSGLVGVLYILDEPSIGLHQRDNNRLIETLKQLRDLGNTVIVVEHDEDTMRVADHIIDIGPGAGKDGGRVVAEGKLEDIIAVKESLTGQYLSHKRTIPIPKKRHKKTDKYLEIKNARAHNLKNITVQIPIGIFTCVTGVSGSGKSTLINNTLYRKLMQHLYGSTEKAGDHDTITGLKHIDKIINIDQSPIGRTPRSNPATYTKIFDHIRDLFAMTQDAKQKGYLKGRFSFNVKGGRCEACKGDGIVKIEMHFLPDVYISCEVCAGKRYNRDTLEIKYKGKTISDVLEMTAKEALDFFENIAPIQRRLKTINDVGLGYIKLGQPATTLSGGEAQRVKIATELGKRSTGRTVYILDEPTTGLHFEDVKKLLEVLHELKQNKNTVVVIEHNLDVIKSADYIIDLGPEGGDGGGEIVAQGTPEEIAKVGASYTGQFLKVALHNS